MTMALSAPLQTAIYERLTTAPALAELSSRIFDAAPHQSADAGEAYVTLGDEVVTAWNTATERGAVHETVIRIYSPARGFLPAKAIAAGICAAICDTPPSPTRGVIVTHEFTGAVTRREEQGALRRIDLTFRFVIEDV